MSYSIGGRIRGRRRSRSMNNRDYLEPVPFIENNRSLRRSARRWQRRPESEEASGQMEEKQDDVSSHETTIQQEQMNDEVEHQENTDLRNTETDYRQMAFTNTFARQQNLTDNQMIHPERRAQIQGNERRRNNLANNILREEMGPIQELINGLQQQIDDLRIRNNIPGFNSAEQQTALKEAEQKTVYAELNKQEPIQINDNPTDHDYRQSKELFQSYEKVTEKTDLIEWFTNFEYACNVYKIPTSFRYLKLTTKLFDETIKIKFMAQRLNQDLTSYEKIKKWLINIPKVRGYVARHLAAIFQWKQKHKTLGETFKNYKQVVMNYVRSIKTAKQMGLEDIEIKADQPSELKLHNIFICGLEKTTRKRVYETMEDLTKVRNVAVLQIVCEYLDKISTSKLGINLNKEAVNQAVLYTETDLETVKETDEESLDNI